MMWDRTGFCILHEQLESPGSGGEFLEQVQLLDQVAQKATGPPSARAQELQLLRTRERRWHPWHLKSDGWASWTRSKRD